MRSDFIKLVRSRENDSREDRRRNTRQSLRVLTASKKDRIPILFGAGYDTLEIAGLLGLCEWQVYNFLAAAR